MKIALSISLWICWFFAATGLAAEPPEQVELISAKALAGRVMQDSRGDDAGNVEYVLINLASGDVRHVVLGSGGDLDIGRELIPLPWSALDLSRRDEPRLTITSERLKQLPRITEDRLEDLLEPEMLVKVQEYAGDVQRQEDEAQAQPEEQQDQDGGELILGRGFMRVLAPPKMTAADEVRETTVRTRWGADVGEIDQLLIDIANGHVAYTLVLDNEEQWIPVPFEALRWSAGGRRFILNLKEPQVRDLKKQPVEDHLPDRVSGSELQKLYGRFDVTPYWQRQQRVRQKSQ